MRRAGLPLVCRHQECRLIDFSVLSKQRRIRCFDQMDKDVGRHLKTCFHLLERNVLQFCDYWVKLMGLQD